MPDCDPTHLTVVGLKPTINRMRVLEALKQSPQRHQTAEDVYQQLVQTGEAVSLSTVYKVLSQFEQVGLLRRNELGQSHTLFELTAPDTPRHGHLLDTANGQVTELHVPDLEQHLAELAMAQGLTLQDWSLTAWGRPATTPTTS